MSKLDAQKVADDIRDTVRQFPTLACLAETVALGWIKTAMVAGSDSEKVAGVEAALRALAMVTKEADALRYSRTDEPATVIPAGVDGTALGRYAK